MRSESKMTDAETIDYYHDIDPRWTKPVPRTQKTDDDDLVMMSTITIPFPSGDEQRLAIVAAQQRTEISAKR